MLARDFQKKNTVVTFMILVIFLFIDFHISSISSYQSRSLKLRKTLFSTFNLCAIINLQGFCRFKLDFLEARTCVTCNHHHSQSVFSVFFTKLFSKFIWVLLVWNFMLDEQKDELLEHICSMLQSADIVQSESRQHSVETKFYSLYL